MDPRGPQGFMGVHEPINNYTNANFSKPVKLVVRRIFLPLYICLKIISSFFSNGAFEQCVPTVQRPIWHQPELSARRKITDL